MRWPLRAGAGARWCPAPCWPSSAGLAGGLFPGLALRFLAAPLAGGAATVDLDAGALGAPGGGFAGGYFAIAAAVLLAAAAAAVVVAGDEPIAAVAPQARPLRAPPLRPLLRLRRRTAPAVAIGRGRAAQCRPVARVAAADRPGRRRRGSRGRLVSLMETNEPLLAAAGFLAAVVVTVVDGRNAVTYASLAAALGLAPVGGDAVRRRRRAGPGRRRGRRGACSAR